MKIYPKTCRNFEGINTLMPFVNKYGGIELQFFKEGNILDSFDFVSRVKALLEIVPDIKEITIHPPLTHYDIEYVILKDITLLHEQLIQMVELSRKYNIKINMVYHTVMDIEYHKALTIEKLKKALKILEGTNVNILLENIFMFMEKKCTVYQICDEIDSPNLKVCMDVTHLHCRANILKMDVREYAKEYLDKKLCKKYTYQVHFAFAANNDGYIDKKTHGIVHDSIESLRDDVKLLKEYGMDNCNYVTEVAEEDYSSRADQLNELQMLEKVINE